ncbi:MAG: SDR family oxidoreductase [Actinobacteria bacterium]|jgi:NAD(P)-dependent dehydrogenase (short-subunit alcohol dehydrogenase family)|nr:MAG: SDR family oxidoreductase [Actinomycetota bacterium]
MDFSGKSIVITGAGAGVGRRTALEMAARGGMLTVSDIDASKAEGVAGEISGAGGRAIAAKADVREYGEMEAMIGAAIAEFGQVDVLINNAGTGIPKPFIMTDPQEWNFDIGICLFGVMNGCRAVLPHMVERNAGRIVNICSDAGRVGEPTLAAYSAAKAGVVGFTKAIAKEVARNNVLVNCVCFSTIRTELMASLFQMNAEMEPKMVKRYPMRRIGEMEEAANTVMLMCSEYVTFVTGQVLSCNGGYAMVD